MDEKYTFERMWVDLSNGYQIYYTYSIKAKGAANGYEPGLRLNNPLFAYSCRA